MNDSDNVHVLGMFTVLEGCASELCANMEKLKQATHILQEWTSQFFEEPTYQNYCDSADALLCKAFPTWPLHGSCVDVGTDDLQDTFLCLVRAVGLFLATASEAGTGNVRDGARLMFEFIEDSGYLPETVIE